MLYGATAMGCSGQKAFLPLLVLAGTGAAAIGVAIMSSSGMLEKTIAFLKNHHQQEVLKVAYGDAQEDRISQLSDDLLSEILSRLDLIEAIRTRILARRWNNICQVRSRLLLDCRKICGESQRIHTGSRRHKYRFLKAVDQTLQLYSGQKIVHIHLICCLGNEVAPSYDRWMQTIATLGVQSLLLKFCTPICHDENGPYSSVDLYPLPLQLLFEATSLKILNLLNCVLQPSFKGKFNSLQYLNMISVPLDNGELPHILASCVNLLQLSLCNCKLPPKLRISGQCLQLQRLHVELCIGVKEIDIHAVNLSFFYLYSDKMVELSLHYVPKLKDLLVSGNGIGVVPYLFGQVVKDCPALELFMLQTKANELGHMPATINMFRNLRMLYLLMIFECKADLQSVATILDACPLLEKLYLLARWPGFSEHLGGAWPARHYGHLKELEYKGFHGTGCEIEFVVYLLQSAPALDRVFIGSAYSTYSAEYKWTRYIDYVMDDAERQLIYKQLVEHALSSKVQVIFRN
ncbi:F-box/FBD/LRR-repeat protein At1g13570 [Coffea arabica]|uniref:F-box/FBD/LRR-repeat protein At1g13570 n=1 Tax=Coffea arabica TaxID=13443 RepID=A0A6P6XEU1_COFAR|nr:putative F-box/LRR-repeat protein At5g54820 [Coffea arabica]XP_027125755.1 putative F-box/LRR-repeat protein At5g54820 [Coffea arabica]